MTLLVDSYSLCGWRQQWEYGFLCLIFSPCGSITLCLWSMLWSSMQSTAHLCPLCPGLTQMQPLYEVPSTWPPCSGGLPRLPKGTNANLHVLHKTGGFKMKCKPWTVFSGLFPFLAPFCHLPILLRKCLASSWLISPPSRAYYNPSVLCFLR